MTGIFDGMAGLLNDVFGGPVLHTPEGGAQVSIEGVFRETPISVPAEDGGEVLIVDPTLQVCRPVAETIDRGDEIIPENGIAYRVVSAHPSGSPASDAFVTFALEVKE